MSEKDDHTLTRYPENQTLTDQQAGPSREHKTLTGGIGGTDRPSQTATPRTSDAFHDRTLTRTGGVGTGELVDKVNWEIGDIIDGRYRVLEVIGRGGKGIVYQVKHLEWQLDLAVKMPLAHLVADEHSKARFIREAQTWVDLGLHPNIVQCWYVRELGRIPRVFMDYIGGGSLKDWIQAGRIKPGAWNRILDLLIQACDGLGYAHEHGVEVHRDVKPGNMLLTETGELLVTDFGIAKRGQSLEIEGETTLDLSGGGEHTVTITGSELGTPEYGAPEQWGQAKYADQRADIYGLGVILFELCCGRRPFDDGVHREPSHVLIGRHLSTLPPDPRTINADIPPVLAEIALQCLAKDPAKRPDSMTTLRDMLVEAYRSLIGKIYRRPIPQAVELRSDALNNRAVSLLDLGKKDEAVETWKEALKLDPYHPESVYNEALLAWDEHRMTDEDVIRQLEDVRSASKRAGLYLGLIHLERAAANEAEEALLNVLEEPEFTSNATVWRALGDARMAQKKFKAADAAYQKALQLIPGDTASLECQTMARAQTIQRNQYLYFPWRHCYCAFEEGHRQGVGAVAILPNGRFFVSGGHDKTLRLWDIITRSNVRVMKGHQDKIIAVVVTPNGRFAASGSQDSTVRLWDLVTGHCAWTGRGHLDWVTALAVTPNGRFIVSGSKDKTLRLWNVETGKCLWTSVKHPTWITCLAITPDGRFILSGHDEENLYLWDLATGKRVERNYYGSALESFGFVSSAISSLAITPDGKYAVTGNQAAELRVWNLKTGETIRTIKGHEEPVTTVAITPDSKYCLSGSNDATLRLWNLENGECLWTCDKHRGGITAVSLSPDGQFAVSSSQDMTMRQIDLDTGECRWIFQGQQGHRASVTGVAMTPHGRFVVSGSQDMTMRMWDIKTASCLRTFDGHLKEITSVAVTPDGQFAISGSQDATLWVWELARARWLRLFEGHKREVLATVMMPDGQSVLSGSADHTIRLWNVASGACQRVFEGHTDSVTSVDVSTDGQFVLSGSADATLRLWKTATAECVREFQGHKAPVNGVAFDPRGQFCASGSHDRSVRLWELATGRCLKVFTGHKEAVTSVVIPSKQRVVLSGSTDKTLRLWDIGTTKCLRTFSGHKKGLTSVVLTPDEQFAISGSEDGTLRSWQLDLEAQHHDAAIQVSLQRSQGELQSSTHRFWQQMSWAKTAWETGKAITSYKYLARARAIPGYERAPELLELNAKLSKVLTRKNLRGKWMTRTFKGHQGSVTSVATSPDGQYLVSGSADKTLRLWDLWSAQHLRTFKGHRQGVTVGVVTPDGRFVISGSTDMTLRLWDLATAKCLRIYKGHTSGITTAAISRYGRFIVSGSADKTLRVWNPATTECLQTFKGHKKPITSIVITPDRRQIISGSEDKTLRLWNASTGACDRILKGHKDSVTAVCLAVDSTLLLSGSLDHTLRLWNLESGKCLRIFKGHEDGITSIVTTPDGRFAISGSVDKTLRLWNLETGECTWVFEQHRQRVTSVAITPNARFVISGCDDKTLRQWELDWELATKELTSTYTHEADQTNRLIGWVVAFFK